MKKIFIDGGARAGESLEIINKDLKKYSDFNFYLFEPNKDYINILENLEKINSQVKFINSALWNKNGQTEFYIAKDMWGDLGSTIHVLDRDNPTIVNTIDIVNVLNWFSKEDYIVLKLDVEGSEYDILDRLFETNFITYINEFIVEWHDRFFDDPNKNHLRYIDRLQKQGQYLQWNY